MDTANPSFHGKRSAHSNAGGTCGPRIESLESRLLLDAAPHGLAIGLQGAPEPMIESLELSATEISENESVTLAGSVSGILGTETLIVDWGDGSSSFGQAREDFSFTHQYLDDDPTGTPSDVYTIIVTVANGDPSESAVINLTVDNVDPAIGELIVDPAVIDESGWTTLTGSFTDPGTLDTHTVTIDWGDGVVEILSPTVGERSFSADHQYLDDDPSGTPSDDYTIEVTVVDDDTGQDVSETIITVDNVDPAIGELIVDPAVIDENGWTTLTGSFTDPGTLDTHTLMIDWGDGAEESFALGAGERSFSADHQYLDDDPSGTPSDDYTIEVTVVDDDTGQDVSETIITVNNVPPVIVEFTSSAPGVGDAAEGEEVTVSGSFTDVGTLDTHTAVIDWGDGTATPATIVQGSGSGTISGTHVYTMGGIYTIEVTLTDDDTGQDVATALAAVSGAGVVDGVLYVIGTDRNDRVKINQQGNGYTKVHASFLRDRGRHRKFESDQIERIEILLGDGNDRAQISGNVDLIALMDGGAGNDHLKAGGGPSVLLGSEGNDRLIGGRADDVLIGGSGRDRLVGGPGGDILIGGTTAFDINDDALTQSFDEALLAILAEWSSDADFATRVANLDGSSGGGGLNNGYFLQDGVSVFDDGAKDRLTGSSGQNWEFPESNGASLRGKRGRGRRR